MNFRTKITLLGSSVMHTKMPSWRRLARHKTLQNSLVRHGLLHFHLSHMVVHHHLFHHLHDHHLHLLLLVQSFTLNLRRGSSANHFLHRPFPFLPE